MSAAAIRYSTRWLFGEPGMTRSAHVRFSTPQLASVGAQNPGMSREYAFTVEATIASNSGSSACCPPTNQRIACDMEAGAPSSWKTGLPDLSLSETCRCPDCPGQSG